MQLFQIFEFEYKYTIPFRQNNAFFKFNISRFPSKMATVARKFLFKIQSGTSPRIHTHISSPKTLKSTLLSLILNLDASFLTGNHSLLYDLLTYRLPLS